MLMTVISSTKAEKRNSPFDHRNHARGRAYVALLSRGPRDTISRTFVQREKRHNGGEIYISVATKPGDVYEVRRWWWDQSRKNFLGGNTYIGFDEQNQPFALSREEAFNNVLRSKITQQATETAVPVVTYAQRVLPQGVIFSCPD